jgi:ketosteroid isomerase-like protein
MPEESTTPDLAERVRGSLAAANSGDYDVMMSFQAPHAVWDMSPMGMGTFEGAVAIRGFYEDWIGAYADFEMEAEDIRDLGNGVTIAVIVQNARPVGSTGYVRLRYAGVSVWEADVAVHTTNYTDIDKARAAAERLAEERE